MTNQDQKHETAETTEGRELAVVENMAGFALIARGSGAGGIVGQTLKYLKGEWVISPGKDDEKVMPLGTRLVVDMSTVYLGFLKWEDRERVDANIAHIWSGERIPRRKECGDVDKAFWPTDDDGRITDPWSPSAQALMVGADGSEFTFQSTSWGGFGALEKLCAEFYKGHAEHPGAMPIVAIGSYARISKQYGRIPSPTFEIVGWTDDEPVKAPAKRNGKNRG